MEPYLVTSAAYDSNQNQPSVAALSNKHGNRGVWQLLVTLRGICSLVMTCPVHHLTFTAVKNLLTDLDETFQQKTLTAQV